MSGLFLLYQNEEVARPGRSGIFHDSRPDWDKSGRDDQIQVRLDVVMTPIHPDAQIIFDDVIFQVLCPQAEQSQTGRLKQTIELLKDGLVRLSGNMDNRIVGADCVERGVGKGQIRNILAHELRLAIQAAAP